MLLIDDELELRPDLTFEEFTKTSLYAGRRSERNGAKFILGDFGSRHNIKGISGDLSISLLFQNVLKYAVLSIFDENTAGTENSEPTMESLENLRDTIIKMGCVKPSSLEVALNSPHHKDSYRLFIEFNEFDPEFSKTHDIWAD